LFRATHAAMASVDHYSLLDHEVPSPEQKEKLSKKHPPTQTGSVSAAIGKENARLGTPGSSVPRFPGEDAGRSLADLARADLDAALQLLADRAQYITEASGVAIALRRGEHNDMLCRARVGSNAPELGALLSIDYGLSGESVRTCRALRCDDTERDPRVNRDLCRELKIASVVIVPILTEQQAVGIFELLSSKPKAFNDRDLCALTRLAEMVVTVVKHSGLPMVTVAPAELPFEPHVQGPATAELQPERNKPPAEPSSDGKDVSPQTLSAPPAPVNSSKKPLFWSSAPQGVSRPAHETGDSGIPAILRNLKKCQACGFPISQGRTFCVECEEKKWHGRNTARSLVGESPEVADSRQPAAVGHETAAQILAPVPPATIEAPQPTVGLAFAAAASAAGSGVPKIIRADSSVTDTVVGLAPLPASPGKSLARESGETSDVPAVEPPGLFLSSAVPTQSWLAANKYILIALLIVAIAIGSIAVLR
jgi:hypothetical protein